MSNDTDLNELSEKLTAGVKKVEEQKAAARAKVVKGAHLLDALLDEKLLDGLTVDENKGYKKITGPASGKAVYVAKRGGRIDLSGFTLSSSAVVTLTEEQAKAKNLGRVRGQFNFDSSDDDVMEAYKAALDELRVATPEVAKPVRKKAVQVANSQPEENA